MTYAAMHVGGAAVAANRIDSIHLCDLLFRLLDWHKKRSEIIALSYERLACLWVISESTNLPLIMLLFRVVVTFCVLGFAYQQQDNDLITTACEITRNETVKAQFFASVREQHGITGNQYGKESLYLHRRVGLAGLSEMVALPIICYRCYYHLFLCTCTHQLR